MSDTSLTGPPFPLPPAPSGIGEGFEIGVSPIGTLSPFNFYNTLLAQFANSPIILQLIQNFAQYLDQTANFELFYENIWDIDTANGIGLDIWGRIVGVNRVITIGSGQQFFGFAEANDPVNIGTFEQAPFFNNSRLTQNFTLSDDAYRTLILAKALANISDGSIPSINQLLLNLFPGRGNCYVQDLGGMQLNYVFQFALSPVEIAIVTTSGVMPKSTGVGANVLITTAPPVPTPNPTQGQLIFNVPGQSGWIPEII